jgi:hypothetical protein
MVPLESGFERKDLISPSVMVAPIVWLCSKAADGVTGNRYIAARWNVSLPMGRAAQGCCAPIGWPDVGPSMQSSGGI